MKARLVKGIDCDATLAEGACRIALVRLDELFSFDPAVRDPAEVEALHDMRIAAKRLRYLLELTEPALGAAAGTAAKEAKALQEILGEIHDCDVMLPLVRGHRKVLRARDAEAVRESVGSRARDLDPELVRKAPNLRRRRGLETLETYLTARRDVLYQRFVGDLDRLLTRGFREEAEAGLADAARRAREEAARVAEEAARAAEEAASGREPAAVV